jgi:hypothetical protein
MDTPEIFNQARMDRCMKIATAIMQNWALTNSFNYTVRATAPVDGLTLTELRKHYFAVGVKNDLADLPFIDLLVVFSAIEQQSAKLKERKNTGEPEFKIHIRLTTDWSDEDAARLLSQMRIETPFDKEKYLRIVAVREPRSDQADDPRT